MGETSKTSTRTTMQVYVVIPDNDRGRGRPRITVRTTPVSDKFLAGPGRDCAILPADLSLDAARLIAEWYETHKNGS